MRSSRTGNGGGRRQRRIRTSLLVMTLGGVGLGAGAWWVQATRDTDLTDPTAGVTRTLRQGIPEDAPLIYFEDVAAESGIVMRHGPGRRTRALPEDTGSGLAWGDVDGDGDPDLYVVNFPGPWGAPGGAGGGNRLYRNDDGHFVDVTEGAGVSDGDSFGMGASFADYDGDGDLDLYVTNVGPNRLFQNGGDGTFRDVAPAAGVAGPLWSTASSWGDLDRDGHLDLYVCNYVDYKVSGSPGEEPSDPNWSGMPFTLNPNSFSAVPNRLYRNQGDGSFEEVGGPGGVSNPSGKSLSATVCDLDGDGWLDIYVNNDVSANALFRNLGAEFDAGTLLFEDISASTGSADSRGSMGLSVADMSGEGGGPDGIPDIFITHWVAQENALYQGLRLDGGALEYRDKTRAMRLGEISTDTVGWGCALVDLDLDGRLDIAVANGSTLQRRDDPTLLIGEPLFLLWNDGGKFVNLAPAAGEALGRVHSARGLAAADYDGDGDVDLAVSINRGQPLLLRNDTKTANRSLTVGLVGPGARLFGATVEVTVAGRRQTRWYGADVSIFSMHDPRMVFGLGPADHAEEVRVAWAGGGETVRLDVPAGSITLEASPASDPRR